MKENYCIIDISFDLYTTEKNGKINFKNNRKELGLRCGYFCGVTIYLTKVLQYLQSAKREFICHKNFR